MIRDRGSNYTAAFDAVLAGAGIRTVLCNVRTPRMNAIAERWIGAVPWEVWAGSALVAVPFTISPGPRSAQVHASSRRHLSVSSAGMSWRAGRARTVPRLRGWQ